MMTNGAHKPGKSSHGHRESRLMLKCTILMLDIYPVLQRQIESKHRMRFEPQDSDENRTKRSRSICLADNNQDNHVHLSKELSTVKDWHVIHFAICMSIYVIELIRYLFIHLIALKSLSEYQYLDCYLLGRFRFIGRTNKISSSLMLTLLLVLMMCRYIFFVLRPKYKFQAVEFMLYTYEQVAENENKSESRERAINDLDSLARLRPYWRTETVVSEPEFGDVRPDPNLYLPNKFYAGPIDCKWILRPNRTSKSWLSLTKFARLVFYTNVAFLITFILTMSYTLAGSIVTNLGFEMAYQTCVAHIQDKQSSSVAGNSTTLGANNELAYSQIYLAPKILAYQKEIDDIPAIIPVSKIDLQSMTSYNLMRIAIDIIENMFWYLEFSFCFNCGYFVDILFAFDIVINARAIKERLRKFIRGLKVRPHSSSQLDSEGESVGAEIGINTAASGHYLGINLSAFVEQRRPSQSSNYSQIVSNYRASLASLVKAERFADDLNRESTNLQSILVDHFQLVSDYNRLVSFYFKFVLVSFFLYSLVISYWISTINSRTVEFEFIIGEVSFTFTVVVCFISAALARHANFDLHALIAQSMALETNVDAKRRWITIMSYYKPKPLYCFVMFGSSEMSWLSCLKVS